MSERRWCMCQRRHQQFLRCSRSEGQLQVTNPQWSSVQNSLEHFRTTHRSRPQFYVPNCHALHPPQDEILGTHVQRPLLALFDYHAMATVFHHAMVLCSATVSITTGRGHWAMHFGRVELTIWQGRQKDWNMPWTSMHAKAIALRQKYPNSFIVPSCIEHQALACSQKNRKARRIPIADFI